MTLKPITPGSEPVSLAEARLQVSIDAEPDESHPHDALLEQLITAAREAAEQFTARLFSDGTYEMLLDGFSSCMALPVAPVGQVTAVLYTDEAGAQQTLDPSLYRLHAHPDHPALYAVPGSSLPAVNWLPGSVRVQFMGGYGDDWPVPAPVIAAIKLTIGHLYANREAVVVGASAVDLPQGSTALLWPYRRDFGV